MEQYQYQLLWQLPISLIVTLTSTFNYLYMQGQNGAKLIEQITSILFQHFECANQG